MRIRTVVQLRVDEYDIVEAGPETERAVVEGRVWMDTQWPSLREARAYAKAADSAWDVAFRNAFTVECGGHLLPGLWQIGVLLIHHLRDCAKFKRGK